MRRRPEELRGSLPFKRAVAALSNEVVEELERASKRFPEFASPHEGWAIILEEVDELKEEVFKQHNVRSDDEMRKEAIQVAAMAMRFVLDLCPGKTCVRE